MSKPYQSPGWMKNSSYHKAPVGDRTHDLPHTVGYALLSHTVSRDLGISKIYYFSKMSILLPQYTTYFISVDGLLFHLW